MGKPERAGGPSLLLQQHLFDTAATAELIWDECLSSRIRGGIDAALRDMTAIRADQRLDRLRNLLEQFGIC